MNGMNDQIERSLASQPLRRPPDALDGRIEAALSPRRGAGARGPWRSTWALPIGAAAAITLALILLIAGPQDQPAPEGVVQGPERGAAGDSAAPLAPSGMEREGRGSKIPAKSLSGMLPEPADRVEAFWGDAEWTDHPSVLEVWTGDGREVWVVSSSPRMEVEAVMLPREWGPLRPVDSGLDPAWGEAFIDYEQVTWLDEAHNLRNAIARPREGGYGRQTSVQ